MNRLSPVGLCRTMYRNCRSVNQNVISARRFKFIRIKRRRNDFFLSLSFSTINKWQTNRQKKQELHVLMVLISTLIHLNCCMFITDSAKLKLELYVPDVVFVVSLSSPAAYWLTVVGQTGSIFSYLDGCLDEWIYKYLMCNWTKTLMDGCINVRINEWK